MTVTKLGFKWYTISDIKGPDWSGQLIHQQYMYYTKKEAIKLFKQYYEKFQIN